MFKIGEHEVTPKELVLGGLFVVVAALAILAIVSGPKSPKTGGSAAVQGQLAYPRGLAADSHGDLYVADSRNHRIQKFSGGDVNKFLAEFGSFGRAEGDSKKLISNFTGKLNEPNGIKIGADDDVYVADTRNGRVQIFTSKGKFKQAMAVDDGFFAPRELAVDSNGFVYVADTGKHRIVKFSPKGEKAQVWGMKGSKPGEFNEPIGLALDQANNLYVADRLNFRIQVFSSNGQFLREWKVNGWSPEQIDMEPHLALDQAHSILYATDGKGKKVLCFRLDGTKLPAIEKGLNGIPLQVPIGVTVDKEGNVYVTDAAAGRIVRLKPAF